MIADLYKFTFSAFRTSRSLPQIYTNYAITNPFRVYVCLPTPTESEKTVYFKHTHFTGYYTLNQCKRRGAAMLHTLQCYHHCFTFSNFMCAEEFLFILILFPKMFSANVMRSG